MRGIKLKNGRLILAAAAALGLGSLLSPQAKATTLPYSTNFGSFSGSDSWATFDGGVTHDSFTDSYTPNSNTGSTASIVTTPGGTVEGPTPSPAFSSQALQISLNPATTSFGLSPTFTGTGTALASGTTTVTASTYLQYARPTYTSGTPDAGPLFGISLFGNSGNVDIGGLFVDASTDELFLSNGSSFTDLDNGLDPAEWDQLQLVATIVGNGSQATSVSLSAYVDGTYLDTVSVPSATLATDGLTTFYRAYLTGGEFSNINASDISGDTDAQFANYSVTASVAVPEPTAVGLIGMCGMLFIARRSRRAAAN